MSQNKSNFSTAWAAYAKARGLKSHRPEPKTEEPIDELMFDEFEDMPMEEEEATPPSRTSLIESIVKKSRMPTRED